MDFLQRLRYRIVLLDQQRVIDLAWFQRWIVMVVVAFATVLYLWDWLVAESDPTMHFPPGLLPPELRKQLPPHGFTSENDARAFAIREIEFAVIACITQDDKPEKSAMDAILMMKSAAMLSKAVIHFHIFTEDSLYSTFMLELDKWPPHIRHRVSFKFSHVSYPESLLGWRNIHKPCSSFKLFIPHVLKDIDHVLFVDNDAVFLNPVEKLWSDLLQYNGSQVASLSQAQDFCSGSSRDGNVTYPKNSHVPCYGTSGVSSGIVLYDIYRLRHSIFEIPVARRTDCASCETLRDMYEVRNMTWHPNMLHIVYNLFKDVISMPDQDIFNIIFHFNPDKLHLLPCSWNFRWRYCESTIRQTKSRFIRAISNREYDVPDENICNTSFLVHGHKSVMDTSTYNEFEMLKHLWLNASYKTPKSDMIHGISNFIARITSNPSDHGSQRHTCMQMNMRLFLKSLEMCPKMNSNQ